MEPVRVLTRTHVLPNADVLDAVLDYPNYFPLLRAFSNSGSLQDLVASYENAQASYKNGMFSIGSFVENHDNPRLQNTVTDLAASIFDFHSFSGTILKLVFSTAR